MPAKGGISNRRKYHNCPQCGKSFFGQTKYCSVECCQLSGSPLPKKRGVEKPCEFCGNTFYAPTYREDARFCSSKCLNAWQGRNKVALVCKTCNQEFKVSPSFKTAKYCSVTCRDNDPEYIANLVALNAAQQLISPNKLEQAGYAILDSLQVTYISQHPIASKFVVDAFMPDANLIIQFDGDYWHGNPAKFTTLDKRQSRRVKIDQSQNKYFAKCGYTVLRFWETDIYKRPEWVRQQITHSFTHIQPLET